jgi:AcrR family transcriptional regulator
MYRIHDRIEVETPVAEVKEPSRTARREATRERVLDAALAVFAERGVIGSSVEDICERAGFTRGAFYSNFADKTELVDALVAREHARVIASLDANLALTLADFAAADSAAPGEELGAMAPVVERILRAMPVDRQVAMLQTELEINAIRQPGVSGEFRDADARFRARIAEFIVYGTQFRNRELLIAASHVADAPIAIVERSVRRALLEGGGADPDAMARSVLPLLLLAVSRPVSP